MKLILKNTSVLVKRQKIDIINFELKYSDMVNYNMNEDVNLIYNGKIKVGDAVYIDFQDSNDSAGGSIQLLTKNSGSYGDNKGLGGMRITSGSKRTSKYPIICDKECDNIKIYTNNKSSDFGSSIYATNNFKGVIKIERA